MRILIDNGEYGLVNRGDMAMMAVTLRRLAMRWPEADLGVLTSAPVRLRLFFPEALPIVPATGGIWPGSPARSALPLSAVRVSARAEHIVARVTDPARRVVHRFRPTRLGAGGTLAGRGGWPPPAVWSSDLVVGAGGGYLTDVDPEQVQRTLSLLRTAQSVGIPTALFGQGIGPLEDSVLVAAARATLPQVQLIALREALRGPERLVELGVDLDRVIVTGDDAIELAHAMRLPHIGVSLGVNLRVVDYTGIAADASVWVREAVHSAAVTLRAPLTPVHVSEWEDEDRRGTAMVVADFPEVVVDRGRDAPPEDAIARVGSCRVMITGTYHAAVFALSQGIPAVCITSSRYYDHKFHGLADQFPEGCAVVELDGAGAEGRLRRAIIRAWDRAPRLRDGLVEHAGRQITASREAYDRVARDIRPSGELTAAA